jgi:hypothetical protein
VELTSDNVSQTFQSCLAEDESSGVVVDGVVTRASLSQSAVTAHLEDIRSMLSELPPEFQESSGGGWSFLNACNDRRGRQWTGLHRTMEELFLLGLAAGLVESLLPRELWGSLPGGMPYYKVLARESKR